MRALLYLLENSPPRPDVFTAGITCGVFRLGLTNRKWSRLSRGESAASPEESSQTACLHVAQDMFWHGHDSIYQNVSCWGLIWLKAPCYAKFALPAFSDNRVRSQFCKPALCDVTNVTRLGVLSLRLMTTPTARCWLRPPCFSPLPSMCKVQINISFSRRLQAFLGRL